MTLLSKILDNFHFTRVLSHDSKSKLVYVLGTVDDQDCILSFEKTTFEESTIARLPLLVNQDQCVDLVENNIYGWCTAALTEPAVDTRIKYIYPATDVHIQKYEAQPRVMLVESPAQYTLITLPYIQSIPEKRVQWVHNILDGSAESDRVIYHDTDRDTGFVVLPDMKWDGSLESLYWVAIAMRTDILSLRSLSATHLPFLKQLRSTLYTLVKEKVGLEATQLRLFIHYQPSYYHFHVHVTALTFSDAPGVVSGQAHLLDTVIDNLELCPDYYQKATIPFVIAQNHALTQIWK